MDDLSAHHRAALLRERALQLTAEADQAARDPDRQHEIRPLLDEAATLMLEADAIDPGGRATPRRIAR